MCDSGRHLHLSSQPPLPPPVGKSPRAELLRQLDQPGADQRHARHSPEVQVTARGLRAAEVVCAHMTIGQRDAVSTSMLGVSWDGPKEIGVLTSVPVPSTDAQHSRIFTKPLRRRVQAHSLLFFSLTNPDLAKQGNCSNKVGLSHLGVAIEFRHQPDLLLLHGGRDLRGGICCEWPPRVVEPLWAILRVVKHDGAE